MEATREAVQASTKYNVSCIRSYHADGSKCLHPWDCQEKHIKIEAWSEEFPNLVTTEGLNELLTRSFKTVPGDVLWYVFLKGTGSVLAAHTMASHSGWSEITPYTGNRPAWTPGSVSAGSVDNSASKAVFAITADLAVYGAGLTSANTGTAGKLYGAGDFTSMRDAKIGDTLNVQVTPSVTAS